MFTLRHMSTRILSLTIGLSLSLLFIPAATAQSASANPPPVTRGEFVRMLVRQRLPAARYDTCMATLADGNFTLLFSDVSRQDPSARELCVAMKAGFIRGYADGSFRPNQPINLAEAAKILARAYTPVREQIPIGNGTPWFRSYIDALSDAHALPLTLTGFDQTIDVSLAQLLMDRMQSDQHAPSLRYRDIERIESERARRS